jgi:hypothetical protein
LLFAIDASNGEILHPNVPFLVASTDYKIVSCVEHFEGTQVRSLDDDALKRKKGTSNRG